MMKRLFSFFLTFVMIFSLISVYATPTYASVSGTTNKYTYIRMSPYWTAEVVDNLTANSSITILEREYNYLYIEYVKSGVTKRGYMPIADTNNGVKYAKIATNQGTQGRVLRIAEKSPIINNNVDIYTKSSPSKDQEFLIEKTEDLYSDYYYIKARCSGNFMMLGVSPSDSGVGGEIYLRYPENSNYNKWEIEAASVEGTDYSYLDYGLPVNVTNGISASYNMTSINRSKNIGGTTLNFTQLNQEVLNSWNKPNSLITLSSNSSSANTITWSNNIGNDLVLGTIYGKTTSSLDGSVDIIMYYGSIYEYCGENTSTISKMWKSILAHEIGHTLWLGHILRSDGTVSSASHTLMAHNRNRQSIYEPTNYDISALKKRVSNK